MNVLEFGGMAGKKRGKKDKKERERVRVWRRKKEGKERKKCHVWRIKKEGEKKGKRRMKYYYNKS